MLKTIPSRSEVLKFHFVGELQDLHPHYGVSNICVWFQSNHTYVFLYCLCNIVHFFNPEIVTLQQLG
jgi:hypothetical protein